MQSIILDLKELFSSNRMAKICAVLFIAVTAWWIINKPLNPDAMVDQKHIWTSTYMIISALGGIFGIVTANHWGGWKSLLGRSLMAFSIGLLLQTFGQIVYNYYTLFSKVEAPYPSLGDIGYFGSIPAYIYGVICLARVSGIKVSFSSYKNQLLALLLPALLLVSSYFLFLKGYEFDWQNPLLIFLDFGYPLGQAIYVSIALLVLIISQGNLGGIMKKPILLLLVALVIQYVCDFNFLFRATHDIWYTGGTGDYLYALSYFVMAISLIYTGQAFQKIKAS